jgi:hypothetical protein
MPDADLLVISAVAALVVLAYRSVHAKEPTKREELARIRLLWEKTHREEFAPFE